MTELKIIERLDELKTMLEDKSTDRWLTLRQACQYTSLSRSTIMRLIQSGQIKASRKTGRLLFRKVLLDEFLNS